MPTQDKPVETVSAPGKLANPFKGHIPALDGVRGFAAATVFVYHYGGGAQSTFLPLRFLGTVIHFGWAGVSLFFVLSGFLISGILWDGFQKPNWWKRFYARRSLRIFPLYYLAILLAFVVGLLSGSTLHDLSGLWVYLLYLGDIPSMGPWLAHIPQTMPLSHFWSLAVEEQFYMVWPFLLMLCAGKRGNAKRLIIGLWIASFLFRLTMLWLHQPVSWQWEFLLGRTGELLTGAYLAMIVRGDAEERKRFFSWLPATLAVSFVLLVLIIFLSNGPEFETSLMSTVGLGICSIFFVSIVGTCLKPGPESSPESGKEPGKQTNWIKSFFLSPFLRWLGKISYGIYVYHLLLRNGFIWVTDQIAPGVSYSARLGVLFGVALVGTLAVASLSFYTFETAFLHLKERVAH